MKRASFVRGAGLGAVCVTGLTLPTNADAAPANGDAGSRAESVYRRRVSAAAAARAAFETSESNGDEERYAAADYVGSFAKLLPHEPDGRVVRAAYVTYRAALESGSAAALDGLPFPPRIRELVRLAYTDDAEVAGGDGRGLRVTAAPRLDSRETGRETVELYWQALTRDVPFAAYESDPAIAQACAELTRIGADTSAAAVSPTTVFRGGGGARTGPHLSQFVWRDIPCDMFASLTQHHDLPVAGSDFLVTRERWLAAQTGKAAAEMVTREGRLRYLATGRDLADYVLRSDTANVWRTIAAIVDELGPDAVTEAFDVNDVCCLTGLAGSIAFAGVAYQKFGVHRRLRPEELGGLLERDRAGAPVHEVLRTATVLDRTRARTGSLLLPQAYVRGCPPHPAYPAGHATAAGVGATILKAFVKPGFVIPNPVFATADGLHLEPYTKGSLTLGGEIDKFAANYAYGRDTAGVHFRSDSTAGLRLGEAAAISVLHARAAVAGKGFAGFRFTSFDGKSIEIA